MPGDERTVHAGDHRESPPEYCCYGCRFAASVARDKADPQSNHGTLTRLGISIFFTLNVMMFTMVLWTDDIYRDDPSMSAAAVSLLHDVLRYLVLLFTIPVVWLLGLPLIENALADLRRWTISTDLLLFLGVLAACVYSMTSVWHGHGHVYFEVACVVLVAVTLGRWLEATGKQRTTEVLRSLQSLIPTSVRRITAESSTEDTDEIVATTQLVIGDRVRVLPGERIPVDGQVEQFRAMVDEQVITGESQPVVKAPPDAVFAGSMALDGPLVVAAAVPPGNTTMDRLVEAVLQSAMQKERYGRLADRASAIFLPAVLVIAFVTLIVHQRQAGLAEGLLASLAVVLIACPCALALATPMAIWAALGTASAAGILFRRGDALSQLAEARVICFDKTGTLTTGHPRVDTFHPDGVTPLQHVRGAARALAQATRHPLAQATELYLSALPAESIRLTQIEVHPGMGVKGEMRTADGTSSFRSDVGRPTVMGYLGSARWMHESGQRISEGLKSAAARDGRGGQSLLFVAWDGEVRGFVSLQETLRPQAKQLVSNLTQAGFRVMVLTGDRAVRGRQLAEQLGVTVHAELLPEQKQHVIAQARAAYGPVVMVGDGVNDLPALALADVGVAMGCGADITCQAADVCLMSSDLNHLPLALQLAKRTVMTIRWNLFWSFLYNIVGIGMAAVGWLNPIVAAGAMVASSVLVMSHSLRLARRTPEWTNPAPAAELQISRA